MATAHFVYRLAAAGGDFSRFQGFDHGLGGEPAHDCPAGASVRFAQRRVARNGGPAQGRHRVVDELIENNSRAADVEQVERRALDLPEDPQIVRPLKAAHSAAVESSCVAMLVA